jgi:hypothetical protein
VLQQGPKETSIRDHVHPHLTSPRLVLPRGTLTWDLSHHIQQGCKVADERGNGIAPLSSHEVT